MMGMFTSVVDSDDVEWQFKCGWDDCDTYRVGDKVDQRIIPDELFAGKLLDGAYLATDYDSKTGVSREKWVVIRDATILALCDVRRNEDGTITGGSEEAQRAWIEAQHSVELPPLDSWTDAAYLEWARKQAETVRCQRKWNIRTFGMSPEERAALAVGEFTKHMMAEDSFLRKILPPVPYEGPVTVDELHTLAAMQEAGREARKAIQSTLTPEQEQQLISTLFDTLHTSSPCRDKPVKVVDSEATFVGRAHVAAQEELLTQAILGPAYVPKEVDHVG